MVCSGGHMNTEECFLTGFIGKIRSAISMFFPVLFSYSLCPSAKTPSREVGTALIDKMRAKKYPGGLTQPTLGYLKHVFA